MTPKGNQYAIAALKDRRATMAGEIESFKRGIAYRMDQLAHLDASLRLLDPSYRADAIAPKRLRHDPTLSFMRATICESLGACQQKSFIYDSPHI